MALATHSLAAMTPLLFAAVRPCEGANAGKPSDDRVHWRTLAPIPQGAVFAATTLLADGRLAVVSGSRHYDVALTAAVHLYDPTANGWKEGAPIPTPRTSAGAALGADGRIYVAGGLDTANRKNAVEAYDAMADAWTECASLPTPRDAPQAVAAAGADGRTRIFVIGGRDRSASPVNLDTVEAYDSSTDRWTAAAPMPTPRHGHAAVRGPDGRIYVVGGTNEKVVSMKTMEIYDPRGDSWSVGPPAPDGVECAALAVTPGPRGLLILVGGWDARKRPVRSVSAYDPAEGRWRRIPPARTARAAAGAVAADGTWGSMRLYYVGGTGESARGKPRSGPPAETMLEFVALSAAGVKRGDARQP